MPTTESSSPTATRAVKEKRRPPLTTLATRLTSITRSCRSKPRGLTLSTSGYMELATVANLEPEALLTSALGERPDPTVVAVAGAVEDAGLDPGLPGALGDQLAGADGLLGGAELAQLGLGPADGGQGVPVVVVDQLSKDA